MGLRFVPFPRLSSSGDQLLGDRLLSYHLPRPSRSVFWVYNCVCLFWGADLWLRPSRQMSTVQNPKESWLAMKSDYSLVNDTSLGPQLPSSGSGCSHLPVFGGGWASPQPTSSAQSFVL